MEASRRINVSPLKLVLWENGLLYPKVEELNKLERAYQINYDNIIFLRG